MSKQLIDQIAKAHREYAEKIIELARLAHLESKGRKNQLLSNSWETIAAELKATSIRASGDEILILRKITTHTIL